MVKAKNFHSAGYKIDEHTLDKQLNFFFKENHIEAEDILSIQYMVHHSGSHISCLLIYRAEEEEKL